MMFFSTRVNIKVIFWLTVRMFFPTFFKNHFLKDWLKQTSTENKSILSKLFVNENIMDAIRYIFILNYFSSSL